MRLEGADEEIRTPDRPRANRLAFSCQTQGRRITMFPNSDGKTTLPHLHLFVKMIVPTIIC